MLRVNPAFIARNHQVQSVLAAALAGDLGPLDRLLGILSTPYDDQPGFEAYARPPGPDEIVRQTFCGT